MQAFDCKMCGQCCEGQGGIVLSAYDLARISEHLALSSADFSGKYAETRGGKLVIRSGADNFCVFFAAEKGCAVHAGRPNICRAWPFFRGNLVDEISLEMASADCPGINLKVGFAEFRRQGLKYLEENDLAVEAGDMSAANSLKVQK